MKKNKNIFENFSSVGATISEDMEYEIPQELVEHRDVLENNDEDKPNFRVFYLVCALCVMVLSFKLVNIQITHGLENRLSADSHRVRVKQIEPPRGTITDSQGQSLVNNAATYHLDIYSADLPKKAADRLVIYQKIEKVTGIKVADIQKAVQNNSTPLQPAIIRENIDRDTALIWECQLNDLSGVTVAKDAMRVYSGLPGLSHILGYEGKVSQKDLEKNSVGYTSTSRTGKAGLELTYEKDLRGTPGEEQLEVDSKGRVQRTLSSTAPKPGNNLVLSLDNRLQTAAAASLQQALIDNKSEKGVAVAMDARSGGILAYVSLPSYDNNAFAKGISQTDYNNLMQDKNHPLLDRIISGTYPSGSVIKPIFAAAGLQEKTISADTKLNTSAGSIKIGQWSFPDWKVHGITDVRQAIAESNDIFFYALAGGYLNIKGLGLSKLDEWLKNFGFGAPTGIDLPNESSGLVPTDAWKKKTLKESWYIGDSYHLGIGQGYFLSTPIQMAVATSAIANNGYILKPHLVAKEVDNSGNIIKTFGRDVVRGPVADGQNLQVVREGMRQAVTSGSAFKVRDLPFSVAAKTGTAQFGDNSFSHAWFTAFAPYENPEIVVVVMIESGGQGSMASAPVASDILRTYFQNKAATPPQ